MKIISRKLGELEDLKNLEKAIDQIKSQYNAISREVSDIEEAAEIVTHKAIFFTSRKIDPAKVSPKKIHQLSEHLQMLTKATNNLLINLHSLVSNYKPLDKYEERFAKYVQSKLSSLYANAQGACHTAEAIAGLLIEFSHEDLENEFAELEGYLESIKKFTRQIEHYEEYWETALKKKSYLDIRRIVKTRQYKSKMDRYKDIARRIQEVEIRIETFPEFNHNLHRLLQVKGGNYLHAKVGHNIRILYRYDADLETLTYEDIIDHDQQDTMIFSK